MAQTCICCSSPTVFQAYSSFWTSVHFHTDVPMWRVQPSGGAAKYMAMAKGCDVTKTADGNVRPSTIGAVLHSAARYDLLLWLAMRGRERAFREKVLR